MLTGLPFGTIGLYYFVANTQLRFNENLTLYRVLAIYLQKIWRYTYKADDSPLPLYGHVHLSEVEIHLLVQ